MIITLTPPKKKQAMADLCDTIIPNPKVAIRKIAVILGIFLCSFVAFPLGKLQYHHLESFKTKKLTKAFGNFDVLLEIPIQPLQEIL